MSLGGSWRSVGANEVHGGHFGAQRGQSGAHGSQIVAEGVFFRPWGYHMGLMNISSVGGLWISVGGSWILSMAS